MRTERHAIEARFATSRSNTTTTAHVHVHAFCFLIAVGAASASAASGTESLDARPDHDLDKIRASLEKELVIVRATITTRGLTLKAVEVALTLERRELALVKVSTVCI